MGFKIKTIGDEQIKTPKTLPKPIHKDLIQKAINECQNSGEKLLLLMLYSLGLRISELENLKLLDIGSEWVKVVHGKGGKDRMIPLLPEVFELIEKYRLENCSKLYLFEEKEKPLSQNRLRYRLFKIFERVGVKATPHQLRHSFATDLINKGARIVDVSELLGHKELSTTQVYTKLGMSKKLSGYLNAHPMCKE
jgi:integrase/recombinase XerC